MSTVHAPDLIDDTITTWAEARPDLDFEAMATFLRLAQLMNVALPTLDKTLAPHGLTHGEFDVLASLRRGGPGHELTPTALARVAMVSPAGMTNRLDRLAKAGLVERRPDPGDRRGWLVSLTKTGTRCADKAIESVSAAQTQLLRGLSAKDRATFDRVLDKLLHSFAADH